MRRFVAIPDERTNFTNHGAVRRPGVCAHDGLLAGSHAFTRNNDQGSPETADLVQGFSLWRARSLSFLKQPKRHSIGSMLPR